MLRSVLAVLSGPVVFGLICVPTNWVIVKLFPQHFDEQWNTKNPGMARCACFAHNPLRGRSRFRRWNDCQRKRDTARCHDVRPAAWHWRRCPTAVLGFFAALVSETCAR